MTMATPPFQNILSSYVQSLTGDMQSKFEVCGFNRFGTIGI